MRRSAFLVAFAVSGAGCGDRSGLERPRGHGGGADAGVTVEASAAEVRAVGIEMDAADGTVMLDAAAADVIDAADVTAADAGLDAAEDGACMGNLVGTWKVISTCDHSTTEPAINAVCDGGTISSSSVLTGGDIVFRADGTFNLSVQVMGEVAYVYPISCFHEGGIEVPCDDQTAVRLLGGLFPDGGTVGCMATSSTCTCTCTGTGPAVDSMAGGYAISGTSLALSLGPPQSTAWSADYCVQNDTLWFYTPHRTGSCDTSDQYEAQRQ